MNIESRMDEFIKVAQKEAKEDVKLRMDEFEEVPKGTKRKEKEGVLPYGFKCHMTCPHCGEFMEIDEVKEKVALYRCKSCHKKVEVEVEKN